MTAQSPPPLTLSAATRWLSPPRLQVYLDHADGDLTTALDLYLWNGVLAGVAMSDTCHLEVALRNAYDLQLCRQFPNWCVDATDPLLSRTQGVPATVSKQVAPNAGSKRLLADARGWAGVQATHGQVLANLSFGFWVKLTEKDRTSTFWTPMLHRAFPSGTKRSDVHDAVVKVSRFRNRLAHNEPVFSTKTGLRDRIADADRLLGLLDPTLADVVRRRSLVTRLMATCPVPGLV